MLATSRLLGIPSPRVLVALTLLSLSAASLSAQVSSPTSPPVPAAVTRGAFGGLRWLEGTWRGRMANGEYFYERYTFVDDSTISMQHLADSTLTPRGEPALIVHRAGGVRYGKAVATRLDPAGIHFSEGPNVAHGFTFEPIARGGWTATIRGADRAGKPYEIIYQMERVGRSRGQPDADRDAVRRAVLDYVEGFYEGDTAKLVRSVWPEVRKYGYWRAADTAAYRGMAMAFPQGFMAYANGVKSGRNRTPANAPKDVEIYDVQDQTASAKLTAWWGTDYLLLAKENGRWMITHVLWQSPTR